MATTINRTPIIDDDGTGTTGTVLDNAWKQELYDQIDAIAASLTPPTPTPPNDTQEILAVQVFS